MSAPQLHAVPNNVNEVPYQDASLDIWDTKYRLKTRDGELVDQTLDDSYERVAQGNHTRDEVEDDDEEEEQDDLFDEEEEEEEEVKPKPKPRKSRRKTPKKKVVVEEEEEDDDDPPW